MPGLHKMLRACLALATAIPATNLGDLSSDSATVRPPLGPLSAPSRLRLAVSRARPAVGGVLSTGCEVGGRRPDGHGRRHLREGSDRLQVDGLREGSEKLQGRWQPERGGGPRGWRHRRRVRQVALQRGELLQDGSEKLHGRRSGLGPAHSAAARLARRLLAAPQGIHTAHRAAARSAAAAAALATATATITHPPALALALAPVAPAWAARGRPHWRSLGPGRAGGGGEARRLAGRLSGRRGGRRGGRVEGRGAR